MRPAWQRGWNFDPKKLKLYTASPGFVIGESILGVDPLGGPGADVQIAAEFTSITITSPTTVEDGMFVHREVETCTLTATLPAKVDLKNQWIAITYYTEEIYRGRVAEFALSESVEVAAEYKPGNTATKTYRVVLTATNGEERLAGFTTPARTLTDETLAQRINWWTGLAVSEEAAAVDLPVGWKNAGWDTTNVRKIYRGTDQLGSLLDTLRAETRLRNMTFIYRPLHPVSPFVLLPNNRWITGTTQADTLVFSDDPAHVLGQPTDAAEEFVHLGRYVGYTSRTVGMDLSMFPNAVTLTWGQYDIESPPGDGEPVATTSSQYRASGAAGRDVVVDLGVIDVASPSTNNYRLARAVVGTLPLRKSSEPFTRELVTPLQSVQQLRGTVPAMALLEHDGILERVAVLGREQQITPTKWMIRYTLGPPHLLDRSSDFDPGTPQAVGSTIVGVGQERFDWVVPNYPTDATIYEVVFTLPATSRLITSDSITFASDAPVAAAPGTLRQQVVTGTSGQNWWVLYTSNPAPGSGNPASQWREGQPTYLGQIP
jgi:hypothetical protein